MLRLAWYTADSIRDSIRTEINDSQVPSFGFGVDEQKRGVLPTLTHLRQPVRPVTERRTAIRQTVPTNAPVEAETSTLVNKRLFT